jgi:glycosyltransferase involved in cell wall biosynthesis
MNLLAVSNNPGRGSFRDRIGNYLDLMTSRGIVSTIEVPSKSPVRRARQYKQIDRYDVVLLHKKCLTGFEAMFFKPRKARVIFNYDDAVMFNQEGIPTRTHVHRFRRSLARADVVLVGSSYLAQQAAPYHDKIRILPLGLNTAQYRNSDSRRKDGKVRLVWVGRPVTLGYLKPLKPIIQELAARYPNLVLRLVCEEFIDIEGVSIEKIRWTPEIRYRALAEADIGLAPLPDNPFTRGKCTFKVLEYSASELPVIASPIGTNVDHVKDGVTGYLATTPSQWLEKLSTLLDAPTQRHAMGTRGREYARDFDCSVIGEKLCDLILETASGSS